MLKPKASRLNWLVQELHVCMALCRFGVHFLRHESRLLRVGT
ncbi:MAG: hypothetical protein OJF51_001437 [Nitrospira sp.]|nr:MAG: hypothetical protein OJF51_001437 [Nitrospira sp.]